MNDPEVHALEANLNWNVIQCRDRDKQSKGKIEEIQKEHRALVISDSPLCI